MILQPIFGTIGNPLRKISSSGYGGIESGSIAKFLNNIIRLIIVIGGLWALINIILAGYGFLSAADDPKKVAAAWNQIWQSLVGLLIMVGSFVVAGIVGQILFGDATAILNPKIYGP
jgi:hypothetical protein